MDLCRSCHEVGHPRHSLDDRRHCHKMTAFDVKCGRCGDVAPRWGRTYYDCHHYDFRNVEQAVAKDGRGTKRPKQTKVRRAGNTKPTQRRKSVASKVE